MPDLHEWLPVIGGLLFAAFGQCIAHTPVKWLLQWDRQTGYWLYQRELRASGNEKKALHVAGCFYKVFGWIFTIWGLLIVSVTLIVTLLL